MEKENIRFEHNYFLKIVTWDKRKKDSCCFRIYGVSDRNERIVAVSVWMGVKRNGESIRRSCAKRERERTVRNVELVLVLVIVYLIQHKLWMKIIIGVRSCVQYALGAWKETESDYRKHNWLLILEKEGVCLSCFMVIEWT